MSCGDTGPFRFSTLAVPPHSDPALRTHEPPNRNSEAPGTPEPKPGTRNPEPGTRNPEPGTRNPEPGTRNPEPGTREAPAKRPRSAPRVHLTRGAHSGITREAMFSTCRDIRCACCRSKNDLVPVVRASTN